jgi:hypothetical protein
VMDRQTGRSKGYGFVRQKFPNKFSLFDDKWTKCLRSFHF